MKKLLIIAFMGISFSINAQIYTVFELNTGIYNEYTEDFDMNAPILINNKLIIEGNIITIGEKRWVLKNYQVYPTSTPNVNTATWDAIDYEYDTCVVMIMHNTVTKLSVFSILYYDKLLISYNFY